MAELQAIDSEVLSALMDSLQADSGAAHSSSSVSTAAHASGAAGSALGPPIDAFPSQLALQPLAHASPPSSGEDGELMLNALYAPMLALDSCFPEFNGHDAALPSELQVGASASAVGGGEARVVGDAKNAKAKGAQRKRKGEAPKRQRQSNPNKAREERNLEIILLRGKVSEMEQQLATLKATKGSEGNDLQRGEKQEAKTEGAAATSTELVAQENGDSSSQRLTDTWKQLCLRQLQRRIKAERENTRLKRALEGQLKVSGMIQRLLDRPAGVNDIELPTKKRARAMGIPPTDPDADRVIFAHLLSEAETSLREIDLVLEENGIFHTETAFRGAKMRERSGGLFLDVFATSVLPFDFKYTAGAVWKHYKGTQKHFGSVYEKKTQNLGPNDDTIMENFAMEMTSSNTRADFRLRQVVKRSVTAERVVIVWTTDGEPIEYMNKMTNFGFHERGYVVCRPPTAAQLKQESAPTTVLQVCHRISPYESSQSQLSSSQSNSSTASTIVSGTTALGTLSNVNIDGIAQFVFSSLDLELKANQEHIENLLLDETASRRTAAP